MRLGIATAWLGSALVCATGCDLVFGPDLGDRDGRLGGGDGTFAIDADPDHDEDGDNWPDAIDPCPHVNGDLTDGDGDGVGDACDAAPGAPNQHRLYFNAFAGGLEGLVAEPAVAVSIAGDQAVLDGVLAQVVTLTLPIPLDNVEVFTHFTVDAFDSGVVVDLSLLASHNGPGGILDGVSCRTGRSIAEADRTYLELHQQAEMADDVIGETSDSQQLLLRSGDARLVSVPIARTLACTADGLVGASTAPTAIPSGEAGLAARRVIVRFDYLFIVTTD